MTLLYKALCPTFPAFLGIV